MELNWREKLRRMLPLVVDMLFWIIAAALLLGTIVTYLLT